MRNFTLIHIISFNHIFFPISGENAGDLRCYKCSAADWWCDDIYEVISHGNDTITECSSNKCLIAGNVSPNI